MNNKKKLIIGLVILFAVIISIVLIIFLKSKNKETNERNISSNKSIKICKNDNDCPFDKEILYGDIIYDTDIKELKDVIKKFNDDTAYHYEQTLNSKIDNTCGNLASVVNYSSFVNTTFIPYENDKVINLTTVRYYNDICNTNNSHYIVHSSYYSKKDKKIISKNEFMKLMNIDKETINFSILNDINNYNSFNNTNIKFEDNYETTLYYDKDGTLKICYYSNELSKYIIIDLKK